MREKGNTICVADYKKETDEKTILHITINYVHFLR